MGIKRCKKRDSLREMNKEDAKAPSAESICWNLYFWNLYLLSFGTMILINYTDRSLKCKWYESHFSH